VNWQKRFQLAPPGALRPANGRDQIRIEAEGPSGLAPLGVSARSLTPGEQVIAVVHPSIRSGNSALASEIIKQDGTVVPMFTSDVRATAELDAATGVANNVYGTWVPDRSDFFQVFVFGRSSWPLTEQGESAFSNYTVADSPQTRCIPLNAPTVMLYPTVHSISLEEDQIRIETDWMGAERIVYLDGREHPSAGESFPQGHSTGSWEGDTLVIDSRNFPPGPSGNTSGIPSSPAKHFVERLQLSRDGTRLELEFVLEDPAYLSEPVRRSVHWTYRPDLQPTNVRCDLDTAMDFLATLK
jgi:hypothetical protein